MEIYKDIQGYEGLYKISNKGNVKSLGNDRTRKERILKPTKNHKGYLQVCLCKQGKIKRFLVHRLVASAFIENPNNYPQVNHKDEDKTNNNVTNLEWCTNEYNINYSQSKQVLCVETGKIYPSAIEVERETGFSQGNISSACNGKRKQAYGFHWRYV